MEWASFSMRDLGRVTYSFLMTLIRWGRDEMLFFFLRLDFIIPHKFSIRFRSGELPGKSITTKLCRFRKATTFLLEWQGAQPRPEESG
jgi:hypothetical protein